jgi:hypothetical protein
MGHEEPSRFERNSMAEKWGLRSPTAPFFTVAPLSGSVRHETQEEHLDDVQGAECELPAVHVLMAT